MLPVAHASPVAPQSQKRIPTQAGHSPPRDRENGKSTLLFALQLAPVRWFRFQDHSNKYQIQHHSNKGDAVYLPYFPHSSVGKESVCNAEDPSLIPGWGRSAGEGIGYPLKYSWASLLAQLVKNPPAMQETSVRSLGWEYPLEKRKATHSSILARRIPCTVYPRSCKELDTDWVTFTFTSLIWKLIS